MVPLRRHDPQLQERIALGSGALVFAGLGLVLRLAPLHLPIVLIRHGGNIAWGGMIFCLLSILMAGRAKLVSTMAFATAVAVGSEFFRLFHTAALDTFRRTLAGALLIGRVFAWPNMLDYAIGIGLAPILVHKWLGARKPTRRL